MSTTTTEAPASVRRRFPDGFYAGYVAAQLGDRVKHSFTINEFASFVEGAIRDSTYRSAAARPCTSAPLPGYGSPTPI